MNEPPRPGSRREQERDERYQEILREIKSALEALRSVLYGIGAVLERTAPHRGREQSSHDLAVEVADEVEARTGSHHIPPPQSPSMRPPWLKWWDDQSGQMFRKIIGAAILAAAAAAGGWAFHDCQSHVTFTASPKGTP